MTIAKYQGDVVIHARLVATDTTGIVSAANLTLVIDEVDVNGVEMSDTDRITTFATEVGNVATPVKALYVAVNSIPAS